MAAQAFKLYKRAKRHISDGSIVLSSSIFRMSFVQSTSNFATATLSVFGSISNEVADGNGYSTSGFSLAAPTWTAGASAGVIRFDGSVPILTASGGSIANIKGAVVWVSGASAGARKLLCYASLTSSQFSLGDGSTLTVTINANGLFQLT